MSPYPLLKEVFLKRKSTLYSNQHYTELLGAQEGQKIIPSPLLGLTPPFLQDAHPDYFHLTWTKLCSPPPAPRQNRVVEEVQECDLFILLPQDKDHLQ